jgi:uncharacterized protein YfbU (UPF0304 family)
MNYGRFTVPALTVRVDDQTKDDLDALARSRGTTIADLVRPLVDELIGRVASQPGTDPYPVHLTPVERRVLSLQHQILGALNPDDEDLHRRRARALDAGYAAEYADEFAGIQGEMTVRDCELVQDILDMFRVLKASTRKLGSPAVARLGDHAADFLAFGGFDLNDPAEGRMLGYARYLLATERWTDLAEHFDRGHDNGNSHSRTLPVYRRMLEVFQPVFRAKEGRGFTPDQYLLSADELAAVARAAAHPASR